VNPSSGKYIGIFRWPFACLLTLCCIMALVWIMSLIFCCLSIKKNEERNYGMLQMATGASIFIIIIIIGIFIAIIVWISFSEVSSRHARCQFAIVTSYIVNGYYNPRNKI
jgi:heme/copper-type cytochrome/quinol oxidase subunit 2